MVDPTSFELLEYSHWTLFQAYFEWFLELLYVWPILLVTLALTGNLVAATTIRGPFRRGRWRKEYWLSFASLLLVPATAFVGATGAVDPNPTAPLHSNTVGLWISIGMFAASVALGVFWTYRMKGLRWFASAFALVQLWLLIGVGFIAVMAFTGDWI
jgi:hypothetical protein